MEIVNRVARHDYFIEEEYECGMVLTGTEIKSIRLGKANIKDRGYTLIPLKIYFVKGKAKLLLGVCKGKKNYDKREALKEKDIRRKVEKDLKNRY